MQSIVQDYMSGEAVPAEIIKGLNVTIPMINLNEMIRGMCRRDIEKFLWTVPATSLMIDLSGSLSCEDDTINGLMAGRYIEKLFIANCRTAIHQVPPSAREVHVRALDDCHAIMKIASAENIRKLILIKGSVDFRTWTSISSRVTNMELELRGTKIVEFRGAENLMSKISKLTLENTTMDGEEINHHEFMKGIYDEN